VDYEQFARMLLGASLWMPEWEWLPRMERLISSMGSLVTLRIWCDFKAI
jgi:hypothetical protein